MTVPNQLQQVVKKIITNINVRDVFFHMEFIFSSENYYLVELTFRGGGSGLSTVVASYVSKANSVVNRINILLGEKQEIPIINNNYSIMIFGEEEELHAYGNRLKSKIDNLSFDVQLVNNSVSSLIKPFSGSERRACGYFFMKKENEVMAKDILKEMNL